MTEHQSEQRHEGSHGRRIIWNGTKEEALALLHALRIHCECEVDKIDRTTSVCSGHSMLAHDQRAVDGLLFGRRIAARFLAEEFNSTSQRLDIATS